MIFSPNKTGRTLRFAPCDFIFGIQRFAYEARRRRRPIKPSKPMPKSEAPVGSGMAALNEIVADGRKILVSAAGRDLYRLSHILRGKGGELSPPASAIAANQPFSASFLVDLEAVRMAMTNDSLFDPNPYEKIELRVTWGLVTDLATGGTPTIDAANTFLDVQVLETTVGANLILFNKLIAFDEVPITATSSAQRVRVAVDSRRVWLAVLAAGVAAYGLIGTFYAGTFSALVPLWFVALSALAHESHQWLLRLFRYRIDEAIRKRRGLDPVDLGRDDDDRRLYTRVFRASCRRHRLWVNGYCWMTNHVHVVAVPERPNSIALTFRRVNTIYAQEFNKKYGFTGYVWKDRPYSAPMDDSQPMRRRSG